MSNAYHHISQKIPTPIAALALGLASLGWCWDNRLQLHGRLQIVAALLALCLLSLLLLKFYKNPSLFKQDLAHPIVGSVLPTAAMALMLVAAALPHSLALPLWCLAVLLHLGLLSGFVWQRLRHWQFDHLIPGWFVPPIGIVTAVVTSPLPSSHFLPSLLFWFGLAMYVLMLPVMLYRLLFAGSLPTAAQPSLAVLAAPASLCLTGYLSFSSTPAPALVLGLLVLALLMTTLIYGLLPRLLRLPFSPAFAALTFPLVIGATALFKVTALLQQWQWRELASLIHKIAYVELVIATAVCSYVAWRFGIYLLQQYQASANLSKVNQLLNN